MATARQWLEVATTVRGEQLQSAVETALEDLGAVAVTLTDTGDFPVLEPHPQELPSFASARVCGLFDDSAAAESICAALCKRVAGLKPDDIQWAWQTEKDYVTAWQSSLEPMCFGDRLWVCPEGTEPPDSATTVIQLTPGVAFGSGEHPTTTLCLEWLAGRDFSGLTVIDYGCGSGILGITAAVLGADKVLCIDHDPQAVTATRDNALLNGVDQSVEACLPERAPTCAADVLIANIVLDPLLTLRDHFASVLRPQGQLVVTGLLADQATTLVEHYAPVFGQVELKSRDDWRMVSARRRAD